MLTTLIRPDGGSARVLGHDLVTEAAQVRAKVGVTGQFASVDEDLTGHENLILFSRLLGFTWRAARERADQLLAGFELAEAAKRQVRTYSGGMRRRLDIAASLIVTSELLFLDEPTTGLDPRSRNQVWDVVRAIAAEGTTVLLTTQYMEEADRLADRMAVIDHGKVIAEGTGKELKASIGGRALHLTLLDISQRDAAETILKIRAGRIPRRRRTQRDLRQGHARRTCAAGAGTTLCGRHRHLRVRIDPASLDDVFLALTGKPVESATADAKVKQ